MNLFDEIYIRNIYKRNNVRNQGELEDLLNILSSAIGSLTNPEKLRKKISYAILALQDTTSSPPTPCRMRQNAPRKYDLFAKLMIPSKRLSLPRISLLLIMMNMGF